MGKNKKQDKWTIGIAIICVSLFISTVISWVYIVNQHNDIVILRSQLNTLTKIANDPGVIIMQNGSDLSPSLLSQTTLILALVAAGIALFTIFGGFLSVINVRQSKELEDSIRDAKRALENEEEIQALRYLQEGYAFLSKSKLVYAKECFEKICSMEQSSNVYFIAMLELRYIYIDNDLDSKEENYILEEIKKLDYISKLASEKSEDVEPILSQIAFLSGCLYGILAKKLYNCNLQARDKYITDSIDLFNCAIKYRKGDADIYRNMAITYILKNDIENVKTHISSAKFWAEKEPLYKSLVTSEKLSKLFKPYNVLMSEEMKEILRNNFGVTV